MLRVGGAPPLEPHGPAMTDPFDTFGIPPRYAIDLEVAEKTHRELSRALHPDRHAQGSAAERRQALGRALEVNEAWRVLRDPVRRAEALLQRAGVSVGEGREPAADPEFLMTVMEQREALSEARRARDLTAVARLANEIRGEQARIERELGELLDRVTNEAPRLAGPTLKKLGELRYTRRFLEEAAGIEDEIN